jgi:hypothetical protein
VPPADPPETFLDRRLVRAAAWTAPICGVPAIMIGGVAAGAPGALGAAWGVAAVSLNGVVAALISASGGRTHRGIAIAKVLLALPLRLLVLAAAIAVAVLVLDLPSYPVALAVCASEMFLMVSQSWLVLRGPTFVGPLDRRV